MGNTAFTLLKQIRKSAAAYGGSGRSSFAPPEPLPNSVKAQQIEQEEQAQEAAEQQGLDAASQQEQAQKAQQDAVNQLQEAQAQVQTLTGQLQSVQAQADQQLQAAEMDAQHRLQEEKIKGQQAMLSMQEKYTKSLGKQAPNQYHILGNQLKRLTKKVNTTTKAARVIDAEFTVLSAKRATTEVTPTTMTGFINDPTSARKAYNRDFVTDALADPNYNPDEHSTLRNWGHNIAKGIGWVGDGIANTGVDAVTGLAGGVSHGLQGLGGVINAGANTAMHGLSYALAKDKDERDRLSQVWNNTHMLSDAGNHFGRAAGDFASGALNTAGLVFRPAGMLGTAAKGVLPWLGRAAVNAGGYLAMDTAAGAVDSAMNIGGGAPVTTQPTSSVGAPTPTYSAGAPPQPYNFTPHPPTQNNPPMPGMPYAASTHVTPYATAAQRSAAMQLQPRPSSYVPLSAPPVKTATLANNAYNAVDPIAGGPSGTKSRTLASPIPLLQGGLKQNQFANNLAVSPQQGYGSPAIDYIRSLILNTLPQMLGRQGFASPDFARVSGSYNNPYAYRAATQGM